MARRKSNDGVYLRGKTYWLDFRHDGERYQIRLGAGLSKTAAREIAQVKRTAILKGEAGIGRKKKDIRFDDAKELFLEWSEANRKPRTHAYYADCLLRLGEHFSGRKLSQIHAFHLEKYKQARIKAGAKVCVNRELQVLRNLINRCREWGRFEGENPVGSVKLLKELKRRVRFLDHDEEDRLIAELSEPIRTIMLLGIHAGLRVKSEALPLLWGSVDLGRGLLHVESVYAKTGEFRTIPMNAVLREALAEHEKRSENTNPEARVFVRNGAPVLSIRTGFELARDRAGLGPDVTPHTMRHTFASRLVMAGADPRTVQELGGWKSLQMVERYAHLSPAHLANAVELIVGPKRREKKKKRVTMIAQ